MYFITPYFFLSAQRQEIQWQKLRKIEEPSSQQTLDPETSCKCQSFKTCAWSDKIISQISVLHKEDHKHKALKMQFQNQICNLVTQDVWCCKDGEPPTESELKILKTKFPITKSQKTTISETTKSSTKPTIITDTIRLWMEHYLI